MSLNRDLPLVLTMLIAGRKDELIGACQHQSPAMMKYECTTVRENIQMSRSICITFDSIL